MREVEDGQAVERMARERRNERYVPGIDLPAALTVSSDLSEALDGADLVVAAIPAQALRAQLEIAAPAVAPDAVVLSPGPCTPNEAGICLDLIEQASAAVPILGVCLGHQAIGQAFGGDVVRAKTLMHGKTSPIFHNGHSVFAGLPSPFEATRYHSLIVERDGCPEALAVTAEADGLVMGLEHTSLPVHGVQFHPELKSKPFDPHPLFASFIEASMRQARLV